MIFAEQHNFEWVAENKNNVLSGVSFSESIKFFNENTFMQEKDF